MTTFSRKRTAPTAEVDVLAIDDLADHPLVRATRERPNELAQRRKAVDAELQALRDDRLQMERHKQGLVHRGEELSSDAAAELVAIDGRIAQLTQERRLLLNSRAESDQAEHEARKEAARQINMLLEAQAIPHLKRIIPGIAALLADFDALRKIYAHSFRVTHPGSDYAITQSLSMAWPNPEWLYALEQILKGYEYNTREGGAS